MSTNQVINFTGTVNGCNNQPVSNGYVSISLVNGTSTIAYTNTNGVVNFSLLHCGGSTTYSYNAVDLTNSTASNTISGTANSINVNLGTVAACGNTVNLSGVYIAGGIEGRAVVWKDGVPTFLTPVPPAGQSQSAYARKVLVDNNNVYVLGDGYLLGYYIKLWKNGIAIETIPAAQFNRVDHSDFIINNSDVYICYTLESTIATNQIQNIFWKNGNATTLPKDTFTYIKSTGIQVANGDVYISGTAVKNANNQTIVKAVYWKNGVLNVLPSNYQNSGADGGVYFENGNLYFCGDGFNTGSSGHALYWKNGIASVVSVLPSHVSARAATIFVEGNDVYLGGMQTRFYNNTNVQYAYPVYWKNNSTTLLTGYLPEESGQVNDIFVKNNIVYTIGYSQGNTGILQPLYYQNTVPMQLSIPNFARQVGVHGIFVQ